jgi:hypothetical protein
VLNPLPSPGAGDFFNLRGSEREQEIVNHLRIIIFLIEEKLVPSVELETIIL